MSKPHINLMDRGKGPESMDYIINPVHERLSTCPCDSCLNLYKKIHGVPSPMEYRTAKDYLPVPMAQHDNGWSCPSTQARPSPEIEALIKRAPWRPGQVFHGTSEIPIDIDADGCYYLKGSITHLLNQITEIKSNNRD